MDFIIVILRWEQITETRYDWKYDSTLGPFDSEIACYAYIDKKWPNGEFGNLKFTIDNLSAPDWT